MIAKIIITWSFDNKAENFFDNSTLFFVQFLEKISFCSFRTKLKLFNKILPNIVKL